MKKYFLLFIITAASLLSKPSNQTATFHDVKPLLQKIDKYSIIMGNGPKDVYVFIDPLCKYSRKFMTLVLHNKKMTTNYRYHLYLYELPRLHSKPVINYIYTSKDPLRELLKIMVIKEKAHTIKKPQTYIIKQITSLERVAQSMKIHSRPYIIMDESRRNK